MQKTTDQDTLTKLTVQQGNSSIYTTQRDVNKRGQCQQSDTYTEVSDTDSGNLTHKQNFLPSRNRSIIRNKNYYSLRNWATKQPLI